MASSSIRYFATGNTAKGFHSLLASALQGLKRIIMLQGEPGCGKSTLIRQIGEALESRGTGVEWIHSAFASSSVDGVIDREAQLGVIAGSARQADELTRAGVRFATIDLSHVLDAAKLGGKEAEIAKLANLVGEARTRAYAHFADALAIHDEWEKIYIANLDKDAANFVTENMINMIFGKREQAREGVMFHRFLGAATPDGAVDFIGNLTAGVNKRYFIKGRPGTGKSTMLKRIAAVGAKRGYAAEVYHCGFDPDSLDMVIIRQLGVAIFDSTAPHEYFPERKNDEIIDMYELAVADGTDERFQEQLDHVKSRYAEKMKLGIEFLAQAQASYNRLREIYVHAADFSGSEKIRAEIMADAIV
ncbi:MAG TPA: PRK06851 family protein [Bacilli bacterium]